MKLNIQSNTIWALLEVLCSALVLFFIYRIVVHKLGIGALGVWSITLATTSLVRVVDPGTTVGLGRFVAVAYGRQQTSEVGGYFVTALVSTLAFYTVLSVLVFWPLLKALPLALAGQDLVTAQNLIPYVMVSYLMMNLNSAVQGTLVGMQRSDLKSQIVIVFLVVQLILVFALVPGNGLKGLALAQIFQYFLTIIAGYLIAVKQIQGRYAWWPAFVWNNKRVFDLWSFGLRLQAVSAVSFLYDPVSKFIISSVAGVETLGYFEMAQKYILQVRQLVVGPMAVLMPAFAHINDRAPNELADLYRKSLAAAIIAGFLMMGAAAISAPVVSVLWLGRVEALLVIFVLILSAAWFINIVSSPAYVLAISLGFLKWNFWGAALTFVGSPLLALTIGHLFGAIGVVSATVLGMAIGSLFHMIMNCRYAAMPVLVRISDLREFIVNTYARLTPFPTGVRKS